jgi:hypothetical protein
MSARRLFLLALIPITALFGGCSAGNSGDTPAGSVSGVPTGIERFLLFPNPVVSGGSFETNTNAYAAAYYAAVDPNNERETLDEFKAANGFGAGGGNATEHLVVFRDVRDLGYGRRMTGRFVGRILRGELLRQRARRWLQPHQRRCRGGTRHQLAHRHQRDRVELSSQRGR